MRKLRYAISVLIMLAVMPIAGVHATPSDPVQSSSVGFEGIVRGKPPTTAASITFPSNGQTFNSIPVKVGGSCSNDLLVKVFSNGVFVGSAQCAKGAYSLSVDLFSGQNALVAKVFDALDQQGPDSSTVTVTYNQTGFNQSGPPITVTSTFAKRGANPGDVLTWPIVLSGGVAPYAVSVDWGDGSTQLISRTTAGAFDISHKYEAPGVYPLIIKATDNSGDSAFLQMVAVGNGTLAQDNGSSNSNTSGTVKTVYVWWPIPIAIVLAIVSFWLGGKSKLENLRRQADKRIRY